jgi:hypothetical protein
MPQVTQVIESREKADETEAGNSCDAVRVSVLVHTILSIKLSPLLVLASYTNT